MELILSNLVLTTYWRHQVKTRLFLSTGLNGVDDCLSAVFLGLFCLIYCKINNTLDLQMDSMLFHSFGYCVCFIGIDSFHLLEMTLVLH